MKKHPRDTLTCLVARSFIRCDIPYHTIEDEELIKLLKINNPSVASILVDSKFLASYIKNTFKRANRALHSQLNEIDSKISLTCDAWTCHGTLSCLGVTAHWINPDYEPRSITLAVRCFQGSYPGKALAALVFDVLNKLGLTKRVFCITTESTLTYTSMAAHLGRMIDFDSQRCIHGSMSHVIKLASETGIRAFSEKEEPSRQDDVSTAVSRPFDLVGGLKRSLISIAHMEEFTHAMTGKRFAIISELGTEWDTTFLVLPWALNYQKPLQLLCEKETWASKYTLSPNEWNKINQLSDFLEPLDTAKKAMTASKGSSLLLLVPIYMWMMKKIYEEMEKYEDDEIIPAANKMLEILVQHMNISIKKPVFLCAIMLDPRVKTRQLTPELLDLMKLSKQDVINSFKRVVSNFTSESESDSEESDDSSDNSSADSSDDSSADSSDDSSNESIDESSDGSDTPEKDDIEACLYKTRPKEHSSVDREIDLYLKTECEDESCDPFNFWRYNFKTFPTLSNMARAYLPVPASSLPCESIYSVERLLQNQPATPSILEIIQAQLCLKRWIDHDIITANQAKFFV